MTILANLCSCAPLLFLEKNFGPNLIIPYYHMVNDDEVLHVKQLYEYKTVRQFKRDMDFLLENYSSVGLHEILNCMKTGHPLLKKAFLLTFDDGFREMADIVAPILLEKGIYATFFVNNLFLDNNEMCYLNKASLLAEQFNGKHSLSLERKVSEMLRVNGIAFDNIKSGILSISYRRRLLLDDVAEAMEIDFRAYLLANKPYLTSNQVNALIKGGFTIGGHSIDHPLYTSITIEDQLYQSIESVREIRERFSLGYGAFAFPHSDAGVSKIFFTRFYESGLIDLSFGTNGMLDDVHRNHLQRFSMEKPLIDARRIIAIQYARRLYKTVTLRNPLPRA
jgi:peptidoglycan/xylan/chitin deacetylase (PgdA/CDA1 family)